MSKLPEKVRDQQQAYYSYIDFASIIENRETLIPSVTTTATTATTTNNNNNSISLTDSTEYTSRPSSAESYWRKVSQLMGKKFSRKEIQQFLRLDASSVGLFVLNSHFQTNPYRT